MDSATSAASAIVAKLRSRNWHLAGYAVETNGGEYEDQTRCLDTSFA
jgi:hypothetical protein